MADRTLQNFVNGKYTDASEGRTSDVVDPSTGEVYAHAPVSGRQDEPECFSDLIEVRLDTIKPIQSRVRTGYDRP